MMNVEACFRLLAERLRDDVVVTSAGNCSELWWETTGETERVFYLEALVERQLALPNLKHFVVANGCYGSTNDLPHPFGGLLDYAAMARAAGLARVIEFSSLDELAQGFDAVVRRPGHAFAVLHVAPLGRHAMSPPLDGAELKFRFGRYLERTGGRAIFDAPIAPRG